MTDRQKKDPDCVFCKIILGDIPSRKITYTPSSLAFLDAFPLRKGHCLVIPKTHHVKLEDLSSEENLDLFHTVWDVTKRVKTIAESSLIALHNGKESGQEVPHVHVHIIPRKKEDPERGVPVHSMFKDRPQLSDEEFDSILQKLKQ